MTDIAHVPHKVYVSPVLFVSIVVAFGVSLALLACGLLGEEPAYTKLGIICLALWVGLFAIMLKQLHTQWQRTGYPQWVGLAVAAVFFLLAYAVWWVMPGSSNIALVPTYKRALAQRARWLAVAFVLMAASTLLISGLAFWLALVACGLTAWRYHAATADYLLFDD